MVTEECIRVGELEIQWQYANPVLEATRHGERVSILVSTDLEEQLALRDAFKKPTDRMHAALGLICSQQRGLCILRWDFRLQQPYVAVYQ